MLVVGPPAKYPHTRTAQLLHTLMTPVARAQMSVEGCALDRRRSSTPVSTAASASLCATASRSTAHRQAACAQQAPSCCAQCMLILCDITTLLRR